MPVPFFAPGLVLLGACTGVFDSTTPVDDTFVEPLSVNPCNPHDLEKPPIWEALADLECADASTRVQAGADVTPGATGEMVAEGAVRKLITAEISERSSVATVAA